VHLTLIEWWTKQAYLQSFACRLAAVTCLRIGIRLSWLFLTNGAGVQSDACFEAMQIDWPIVRQQAIQRGVIMTRVAVRDFDHNDQVGRLTD